MANSKETTNANPLHHLQIPGGIGLIVSNSSPIMQRASGRIELASKSRNRSLSTADHSCTDSRRKTTTTPAKPANATAICAAMPRASPGSILNVLFLLYQAARISRFPFLRTRQFALLFSNGKKGVTQHG